MIDHFQIERYSPIDDHNIYAIQCFHLLSVWFVINDSVTIENRSQELSWILPHESQRMLVFFMQQLKSGSHRFSWQTSQTYCHKSLSHKTKQNSDTLSSFLKIYFFCRTDYFEVKQEKSSYFSFNTVPGVRFPRSELATQTDEVHSGDQSVPWTNAQVST